MLLCDGAADRLGVTAQPRVLGADDAFQLGELAHELGGLVRLGQPGGLARVFVSVEPPDELDEPRRLVRERAAALDERDPLEPPRELFDADGDVAVEGEGRILELGPSTCV